MTRINCAKYPIEVIALNRPIRLVIYSIDCLTNLNLFIFFFQILNDKQNELINKPEYEKKRSN